MARLDEAFTDGQLSPDEHEARVGSARTALTVPDLDALLRDLQLPATVPTARYRAPWYARLTRRGRVGIALTALAVIVAIGAGIIVWFVPPSGDRSAAAAPPGAAAPPAAAADNGVTERLVGGEMFTEAGMNEVVSALRKRFGTTVIEGVHFYRDSAVVRVPEAESPVGAAWYTYSLGGDFHSREVYGGLSVSSGAGLRVDLAHLDTAEIAAVIRTAPEKLGLTTATMSPNERFRVTVGGDGGGEVWMGINDIGIDSHLVTGLDGAIKGVHRCGWGC
ncbi:hypothetical protein AXK60_11400 [Tsukamurella pseudospumae]|uniref:DUF1707 domain-containing protein n=2 Tax=Tsukamurella pseudospumae TaxID=239498 RepID=A0A138A8F6_9ACTN|nr:hypothetical protein AXK61_06595 [Tsukamurella pseudospumae]KXP06670.1 hypothetical protein AXK60_11400 [Tsukamurella pseudospumae]